MNKIKRPKITKGPSVKVVTGCGNSYVTCNVGDHEEPVEVFCSLGKAGGCAQCMNEALTRAITLGLKYGIPPEEYVTQLAGLGCPSSAIDPEYGLIKSCPEAIAKVMGQVWMSSEKYSTIWKP